ncbi:hypothetical protein CDAR_442821 [Caerostris darwini]|uniref:Uncharacterized protein n=1 Tax=Caerostris darwini TaxID=1538125 RepID=A0AAV4VM98_9ARAC|nr:hypothetical protein CDAR_442821 [Caerostris darwini]
MKVSLFRENQPKPRSDDQAKDIPSIKLGFYYVKLMQRLVDAFITSPPPPLAPQYPVVRIPAERLLMAEWNRVIYIGSERKRPGIACWALINCA